MFSVAIIITHKELQMKPEFGDPWKQVISFNKNVMYRNKIIVFRKTVYTKKNSLDWESSFLFTCVYFLPLQLELRAGTYFNQ